MESGVAQTGGAVFHWRHDVTGPNDILTFWFGEQPYQMREAWFHGGPAFDAECRAFEAIWESARNGALTSWLAEAESLLAFVVLTDQIPRNIFREDSRSFATDSIALAAAKTAITKGWDKTMNPFQRMFLYLPFEHSEVQEMQDESVRLYTDLGGAQWLEFAEKHRMLIQQFGRFPHRNAVLGRASTPAELAFMETQGRGF